MNDEDIAELKQLFNNEQATSTLAEVAGYLATYYLKLVEKGIPENVAREMTIGFSGILWSKLLVR